MEREAAGLRAVLRQRCAGRVAADDAAGVLHVAARSRACLQRSTLSTGRAARAVWCPTAWFFATTSQTPDGVEGDEGTFNICTFWLVEALTRAGERDPARLKEARLVFERMIGYANHLGLLCGADRRARRGARQFSAGAHASVSDQRGSAIWTGPWGRRRRSGSSLRPLQGFRKLPYRVW